MILFIAGFFCGGFIGVLVMACAAINRGLDYDESI